MSNGTPERYIVDIRWKVNGLAAVNELNNHLEGAGFRLTMMDDEGQIHELGPGTFGLITPMTADEITTMVTSLVSAAINEQPEVNVMTWQEWQTLIKSRD